MGVCPAWTFCGQRGKDLQMQTSALFDVKNFGFFEIYDVSTWTMKFQPVRSADILQTKGEGVNFSLILCGSLLWTAPYENEFITHLATYEWQTAKNLSLIFGFH